METYEKSAKAFNVDVSTVPETAVGGKEQDMSISQKPTTKVEPKLFNPHDPTVAEAEDQKIETASESTELPKVAEPAVSVQGKEERTQTRSIADTTIPEVMVKAPHLASSSTVASDERADVVDESIQVHVKDDSRAPQQMNEENQEDPVIDVPAAEINPNSHAPSSSTKDQESDSVGQTTQTPRETVSLQEKSKETKTEDLTTESELEIDDKAPALSPSSSSAVKEQSPKTDDLSIDAVIAERRNSEKSISSPECTYSGSSSIVGVVDTRETIEGQALFDRLYQAQGIGTEKGMNFPGEVKVVRIPAADSASVGSVASNLDSVGAATLAEQRLQDTEAAAAANQQRLSACNTNSQLNPLAGRLDRSNIQGSPPEQDYLPETQPNNAQCIPQERMMSQATPVLVAVPLQQSSPEIMHQQSNLLRNKDKTDDFASQTQQTVLYQLPGVVTLPMGATTQDTLHGTAASVQLQPQRSAMIQQSAGGQSDQMVGMVGPIPIVKLQGGTMHLVKKKKGRFKFLQDTPTVTTSVVPSPVPANSAGRNGNQNSMAPSTPLPQQHPPTSANANANNVGVPANIAVPSQNQSIASAVSQLSAPIAPPMGQQGLDGINAPKVKKKGRFVVTSVKDPIPKSISTQNPPPMVGPLELPNLTPPPPPPSTNGRPPGQAQAQAQNQQGQYQQQSQPMMLQQQPPQQQQQQQQYYLHQNQQGMQQIVFRQPLNTQTQGPQEVIAHLSIPTTFETQLLQPSARQNISAPGDTHAYYAQPMQGFVHQQPQHQVFYQTYSSGGNSLQQQALPPHPQVDQLYSQNSQLSNQQPGVSNTTPPPTPVMNWGKEDSPGKRQALSSTLPNVPVPELPNPNEKQSGQVAPPKKTVQKRPAKVPQSIGINGVYGNIGLGKLSYFLDQMKTEVSEADRMIKHLQTDMKVLRDKNKELETKNRELERKLKEEGALREKAEARCVEFRKRLRAASGEGLISANTILQEQNEEAQKSRMTAAGTNGVEAKESKQAVPAKESSAKSATQCSATPREGKPPGTGKPPVKPNAIAAVANDGNTTSKTLPVNPSNMHAASPALAKGLAVSGFANAPPVATTGMQQGPAATAIPGHGALPSTGKPASDGAELPIAVSGTRIQVPSPTEIAREVGQRYSDLNAESTLNLPPEPQLMHHRSNSNESASKEFEFTMNNKQEGAAKSDIPRPPIVTATKSVPVQRANVALPVAPQTPQQRPPPPATRVGAPTPNQSPAPNRASFGDFDPLGPNVSTSNLESDVWPVISFPTNVSIGAVPVSTTTSFFQHPNGQTYSTAASPVGEQFNQTSFVSDSPYVVPIAFGMTSSDMNGAHQHIANATIQQPFILQQPIMLQQVQESMQQWPTQMPQQQQMPGNGQSYFQQQTVPPQSQLQTAQQPVPLNPFDPFSS